MKTFHSSEEAQRYADKNHNRGTWTIEETKHGNWRIVKKSGNIKNQIDTN